MIAAGSKIVILGAGESGNGAAILAKQKGFDVFVSDYGMIKEVYKQELINEQINFEEGGHNEEKILKADWVIKSPGIPDKTPIVKKIREAGIPVISEIEFAFQFKGESKIIAITGSNGKSTTTSLTYHLLKVNDYDVSMVGNIGISFAKQVAVAPSAWYVIEVSSFQLDDIRTFRPDIAVILNITPDHLDRYDYEFDKYAAAKFLITKYQTKDDLLILNKDDTAIQQQVEKTTINARIIYITMQDNAKNSTDGSHIEDENIYFKYNEDNLELPMNELPIKGQHNTYNTMAAGISAQAAGLRNEALRNSFSGFEGLAHRLEFVTGVRGVDFINDSKGTNLNSVWFALESMTQPTILILGGQDKGNDYDEIMDLVKEKVKAIVCMGIDNSAIIKAFDGVVQILETKSAKDAVNASYSLAENGDVVLLSPGCASFDLFKNFEDRGEQFKQAVREL